MEGAFKGLLETKKGELHFINTQLENLNRQKELEPLPKTLFCYDALVSAAASLLLFVFRAELIGSQQPNGLTSKASYPPRRAGHYSPNEDGLSAPMCIIS